MFDGSGDLHVFKMLFKEWVELNDWNNDGIITQWLKQCLTGAAKMSILYDNFQDQSTIFDKLDNLYGGHVLIESYNDLLERRAKQPNERLSDLANDIRKVVEAAYADCRTYSRDRMTMNYFVRSLPSTHIRYELTKNTPTSLDQAVQSAAKYEFWFGDDSVSEASKLLPEADNTQKSSYSEPQLAENIEDVYVHAFVINNVKKMHI